jgi:hypothetical protein
MEWNPHDRGTHWRNDMKHIVRIASALVTIAGLWSSTAAAQQTNGMPQTDRTESERIRPNRPLLVAGAAVIAASYIPPVIVAATSERDADKYLYIPVAGPWIDLGERGGCAPNSCETEAVYKTLLVATGVAHIVGTSLIVTSLIVPERRETTRAATSTKPVVMPAQLGRAGAGLVLAGQF